MPEPDLPPEQVPLYRMALRFWQRMRAAAADQAHPDRPRPLFKKAAQLPQAALDPCRVLADWDSPATLEDDGYLVFNDHIFWSHKQMLPYGVVTVVNEICIEHDPAFVYFALHRSMACDVALRHRSALMRLDDRPPVHAAKDHPFETTIERLVAASG